MENIVIELSRWTSTDKKSNAQWTNTLKSGINIEEGDTVLVKSAFIDTSGLDPNILNFNEPINCSMEFAFYIINSGIETIFMTTTKNAANKWRFTLGAPGIRDGLPYIYRIFNEDNEPSNADDIYLSTFNFTIPAGQYTKTSLGEFISKTLQNLNMQPNISNCPVLNNEPQTNNWVQPPPPYNVLNTTFQDTYLYQDQSLAPDLNAAWYIPFIGYPPAGQVFSLKNQYYNIPQELFYGSGKAYVPAYAVQFLTGLPGDTAYSSTGKYLFQSTSKINYSINIPYNEGTEQRPVNDYNGGYIGSPITAISYNQNSGLFEWDYLHEPIVDMNNNEVTILEFIDNGGGSAINRINPIKLVNMGSRSGIMLTALEPASFWTNTLGFNLNNILFDKDSLKAGNTTLSEFMAKTTKNYSAISDFQIGGKVDFGSYELKSNQSITPFTEGLWLNQSTITTPVVAQNLPAVTKISGGHFLLDLRGYSTEYKYQDGDTQIKAIISSFFLSPDAFIASPAPDSASYTHKGQPISLNQIDITIIDPLTHKPVTNLNPNSSVYLQVIKAQKPLLEKQQEDKTQKNN